MTPYYDDGQCVIYHGDCREILPAVDADMIVTDPPYGTGGWRRAQTGAGRDPTARLTREHWDDGATDWLVPIPTLTFWPAGRALQLLTVAAALGLTKHRALYMRKRDPKPQPAGRMSWSVEPIWCLSADGFLLRGGTNWCEVSTPRAGRDSNATGHPYEKPLTAMRWLIAKCPPGMIVDPFMGSGTTLRAAKDLGRLGIGIEIEERDCETAVRRLAQEVLPLEVNPSRSNR